MFADWATIIGELLIAAVIYYEIEENRASAFLTDVQQGEFYKGRAELYDSYAKLTAPTLKGRAEQFRKVLGADPDLRETCDRQWTYFNRLRYMLRFSLFRRRLLVTWFPQVLVSFWVMTALYIRERQELRHAPVTDDLKVAVKESLKEMNKHGLKPITVYSRDGLYKVVVSVDELKQLASDLDSLFR